MEKKVVRKMPAAQAMSWAIEGARTSFEFLEELQIEWEKTRKLNKDGSKIRQKQRIVADAFVVYVASLFDTTSGAHSLVRSYLKHAFVTDFRSKDIVKKCIMHRNNRAGHQSQKYGFVVSSEEILASDIYGWLKEAHYAVATELLPLSKNSK